MIRREAADYTPAKRGNTTAVAATITTTSSSAASTTAYATPRSRSRDPRVVRVSSAYGGKDRHSKVCTVRGLRDRRVRLSVPTAIQLYDLQDRLGLNQPSKVVDWLLNAAKNEIDELPPLQIPEGGFLINPNLDHHHHHQHHHEFVASHEPSRQGLTIKNEEGCSNNHFNLENNLNIYSNFPIRNSFIRLDPSCSNLTLAQDLPRTLIGSTGDQDSNNLSLVNPSLSESHHHHLPHLRQVLLYQPGLINTQHFSYHSSNSSSLGSPLSLDPHLLHYSTSSVHLPVNRPFHFSTSDTNLNLPLQNNAENDQQH